MPFDGLPQGFLDDLVRLKVARDGVAHAWAAGRFGLDPSGPHCIIGWLMQATDGDEAEAVRLAIDYVYPALPPRRSQELKAVAVMEFNDRASHRSVLKVMDQAVKLAEA